MSKYKTIAPRTVAANGEALVSVVFKCGAKISTEVFRSFAAAEGAVITGPIKATRTKVRRGCCERCDGGCVTTHAYARNY